MSRLIADRLPAARRALADLPLPGDGSLRRLLLFAGGHLLLPIDSRVIRVGVRLGLADRSADARKAERQIRRSLRDALAPHADAYGRAYLYLAHHGAATCSEADPHCSVCPLIEDCPFGISSSRRRGGAGS